MLDVKSCHRDPRTGSKKSARFMITLDVLGKQLPSVSDETKTEEFDEALLSRHLACQPAHHEHNRLLVVQVLHTREQDQKGDVRSDFLHCPFDVAT